MANLGKYVHTPARPRTFAHACPDAHIRSYFVLSDDAILILGLEEHQKSLAWVRLWRGLLKFWEWFLHRAERRLQLLSPKGHRWPRGMPSASKMRKPDHGEALYASAAWRDVKGKAAFSSVPALNGPRLGWNMVSWTWLLFLPSRTQGEMSGVFISHRHKGPHAG